MHIKTFFSRKTAPQYTCELFLASVEDSAKFRAAFKNRNSYSKAVHDDVQIFVSNNIERWMATKPLWFKIEKIPDDFLTVNLFEAQGRSHRRRSSVVLELAGLETDEERIARRTHRNTVHRQAKEAWKTMAEEIYEARSNVYEENVSAVERLSEGNMELLKPLVDRCPTFKTILAHILLNKRGFRAREIDWTSEMVDWGEEETKRVGQSFVFFLRKRKAGEAAVGAWRKKYAQLETLFKEVIGFEEFVVMLANNLMKDTAPHTRCRCYLAQHKVIATDAPPPLGH